MYYEVMENALRTNVQLTDCLPPCSYTEYRIATTQKSIPTNPTLILWLTSPYLLVETEQTLYPFQYLVADVGGTLGLFLGISFMTFWDVMKVIVKVIDKKYSCKT